MTEKLTKKWKPTFTLTHLNRLPEELKAEGEKLKTIYEAFERVAPTMLYILGAELDTPYVNFLKTQIEDLLVVTHESYQQLKQNGESFKEQWFERSLGFVLLAIIMGHKRMDEAYLLLKRGKFAEFSGKLSEAGFYMGRLSMVSDLMDDGAYEKIGATLSSIAGASLGGKKSGATRRKQSRVPPPATLRNEQKKLFDAGKPPREISAMLASKYGCTTDHIRKLLKRD